MVKKKENPSEMPVEDRLKNLYQLQTILTEIDRIRTLRGELPLEVEDLEDTIEDAFEKSMDKMEDKMDAIEDIVEANL